MPTVHGRIREVLDRGDLDVTVHEHASLPGPIRSPQDFADALGYSLDRITKSVFLRARNGASHAVAVCAMGRKLDMGRVAGLVGTGRMELAGAEELARVLDYPRHGVSPLGVPSPVMVLVDAGLLDQPTILVGGGAAGVEVEIAPRDLVAAAGAVVADLAV
ncbi:aminoacyl-tRNA deacylase [Lolliginicoccus suaedae]|uniref:aminoacyl-tRNA deacylase n=1 Tax=Lolliginicoccus suaedae TaxID=2605429 RepID=UPI001658E0F8|nr:YbaK/EbsC family protein [Lolliginicoccus suaedae]